MKVLFIVPYPIDGPSTRYRVWQYLPYLQSQGIEPTVRPFVDSSAFYELLYRNGYLLRKAAYTLRSLFRRATDLLRLPDFEAIFIQREAFPLGPAVFERLVSLADLPVIFDFDDTIYLPHASEANHWISWLKQPAKTADIIRYSTCVIAGNEVLARYATRFNRNVIVIPTSIDTDRYTVRPPAKPGKDPITIGWIGSGTTVKYLHQLSTVFRELVQRYAIRIIVVGARYELPGVEVICRPWSLENELSDLHSFDIGVMPLPDDEWTRGKCGLKALQYMGVGVPAVVSPVGVNNKIVTDGVNGFLANSDKTWFVRLSALVEDPSLRRRLGLAGRATVEEQYSLRVNAPHLLRVIRSVTNG
ncbi:MAG: glycosyltransferase family 4 protein [Candidatus Thorarchaeota archaeon]